MNYIGDILVNLSPIILTILFCLIKISIKKKNYALIFGLTGILYMFSFMFSILTFQFGNIYRALFGTAFIIFILINHAIYFIRNKIKGKKYAVEALGITFLLVWFLISLMCWRLPLSDITVFDIFSEIVNSIIIMANNEWIKNILIAVVSGVIAGLILNKLIKK